MAAQMIDMTPTKTYATRANAEKAFLAKCSNRDVRWFVAQHTDGRFFPVAVGEKAIQEMVHFHFKVIG